MVSAKIRDYIVRKKMFDQFEIYGILRGLLRMIVSMRKPDM